MSRKILIIGAEGQLAFDLINVFKNKYHVIKAGHKDFDVVNTSDVWKFIKKNKPDIVINTAAFHNTKECQLNPEKSFQVNALGAFNVSSASSQVAAKVIFMSTNYVFDGKKKKFTENDSPNPLNVYGASKLAGEILTKIGNKDHYIIRTSGLFGIHRSGKGHNFVNLMLEKAQRGEAIKVVSDEITSVTYTPDLASKIYELLKVNAPCGTYHLVNDGKCSWYEFAKAIFNLSNTKINLSKMSLKERSPEGFARPVFSAMDSVNLKKAGLSKLRPWKDALKAYLTEHES